MMRLLNKMIFIILMILVPCLPFIAACSNSETPTPIPTPTTDPSPMPTYPPIPTPTPAPSSLHTPIPSTTQAEETVKITIGNLSDITGVSGNVMKIINMALEDTIEYYNRQNLIPGVELEIITYDGQYNSSLDITGYEWLKENGADLIFTAVPPTAVTLKPYVEADEMVLFTWAPTQEAISPPGYVFSPSNTLGEYTGHTLLKCVADNDPDFPADRPAIIGGAYWIETYGDGILSGAKEYALAHPEQYEWDGGYLIELGFNWDSEVEQLKRCDYVLPPVIMASFVQQYRNAGHQAKFLGTDAHLGFLDQINASDLWDELDGALFVRINRWWNEDDERVTLAKNLLRENHPDEAEEIIKMGVGYLAVNGAVVMFEIIADAVESVGPENFNSQALYDAAESFSYTVDGIERDSFSKTKRTSLNYMGLYEARAADKDIYRVLPEWYPIVYEP